MPTKGTYDRKTADAINRYGGGSFLRSQSLPGIAKDRDGRSYRDPELSLSANARNNVGHFEQGEAMRDLRKKNPGLTDYGARQTLKVGAAKQGDPYSDIDSYKKGGIVRKTGLALLHKGERVLTTNQAQSAGGAMFAAKRSSQRSLGPTQDLPRKVYKGKK